MQPLWYQLPVSVNQSRSRFTAQNLNVRYCFVKTPDHCRQLLNFCQGRSVVAIDTEKAPFKEFIDLVQISDGEYAYLCPLQGQLYDHLKEVAANLFGDSKKTVLQFGLANDVGLFIRALGMHMEIRCTLIDVQARLAAELQLPKGQTPSLEKLVNERWGRKGQRVFSKAWRISGWNILPLHSEQAEYAALDPIFTYRLGYDMVQHKQGLGR